MKKDQAKGFTFKVAEKTENKTQVKARDGVAVAGCSWAEAPWGGQEPKSNYLWGLQFSRDGGYWC